MKFVEPKVEFVKISSAEVVLASSGEAGGVEMCIGSGSQCSIPAMKEQG